MRSRSIEPTLVFRLPFVCFLGQAAAVLAAFVIAVMLVELGKAQRELLQAVAVIVLLLLFARYRRGVVLLQGSSLILRSGLLFGETTRIQLLHTPVCVRQNAIWWLADWASVQVEVGGGQLRVPLVSGARYLSWTLKDRALLAAYGIDPSDLVLRDHESFS